MVALLSAGIGDASSPIIWAVDGDGKFAQDRFEPGTYYLWARHGEMLVFPPAKIEISDSNLDERDRAALSHKGARVRGRIITRGGTALDGETRAVLFGRSPLALPRKAVGEIDRDGAFVVGALLPGRYEISVRVGRAHPADHQRAARGGDSDRAGRDRRPLETIVVRPQAEE